MSVQILSGQSLAAAGAPPEPGPALTFVQKVAAEARDLHHLRHRAKLHSPPPLCQGQVGGAVYLSALVASVQHRTVSPVMQVQSVLGERLVLLAAEDAQTERWSKDQI